MNSTNAKLGSIQSFVVQVLAVILVAAAGLGFWEASVAIFKIQPGVLPSPRIVFGTANELFGDLLGATIVTMKAAFGGLFLAVIVGSLIGIAFSLSRAIRTAFFPYVVFLQTVPIIAIAPLLVIWYGYEFRTVLIVTVIVCLFPIVNSVTTGLLEIDRQHADLFRLFGASRWQRLTKLQIPSAVPYLILGTKTSSGLAVIGAIIAEFFVSSGSAKPGLGTLINRWGAHSRTDAIIAALFATTLVGLIMFGAVSLFSVLVLKRYQRTTVKH